VNGLLDSIPVDQITRWESEFRAHLTGSQGALLNKISEGVVTPELEAEIKKVRFISNITKDGSFFLLMDFLASIGRH
jgi:ATP synthase alpha/beta chain, C terminal domain